MASRAPLITQNSGIGVIHLYSVQELSCTVLFSLKMSDQSEDPPNHVFFGLKESCNLSITVDSGKSIFHCHWDVLACSSKYFEKLLIESKENLPCDLSLPEDSFDSWNPVLSMLYPPMPDITLQQTLLALPVIHRLQLKWMSAKIRAMVSKAENHVRTPYVADIICSNGLTILASM